MASAKLNARTVESLKPTPGKRAEIFDAAVPGLALRITENGVKSWSLLYRVATANPDPSKPGPKWRQRRMTLGTLKALSLADARDRARTALAKVHDGGDPAAEKQQDRRAHTVADLIEDYVEKHAKKHKRSWREDRRMLQSNVLPAWKHRAIADIKRRDVRTLIDPIAERAPVMGNRVLAVIRKMFSCAVDWELTEANPAARIGRPGGQEHSRERVLSDDELRQLWAAFSALPAQMAAFYKLRLVTAQRGGEVSSMRWSDVDLDAGWWSIPATRSKNKKGHRVPLSSTALAIIKGVQPSLPENGSEDFVLAGARGRRQQSEAAATFAVPDFRGHDLRRTAASLMAGGGVSRLVIGRILNHAETGITAVYDRHSYDSEKRAALDWWAVKLAAIIENKPSRVLPFAASR